MRLVNFAGCCRTYILADLGGVHGHVRARNQDEFDRRVEERLRGWATYYSIVAITNTSQQPERRYLEAQGWTPVEGFKSSNSLVMHSITVGAFRTYMNKKVKETRARKFGAKPKPVRVDTGVFLSDVRRIIRQTQNTHCGFPIVQGTRQVLNNIYNVTLSVEREYDGYEAHAALVQLVRARIIREQNERRQAA